jgi:predicted nucleic acid-binding protein
LSAQRGGLQRLVLAASVVIPLVRDERFSVSAWRLLSQWRAAGGELIAPFLLWLELANVLVRYSVSPEATLETIHGVEGLGIRTVPFDRPLLALAVQQAHTLRLTIYDSWYLAVAESEDGRLATADRALAGAAGNRAILLADDSTGVHESPASYDTPASGSSEPDPDAWPGFDRYVARLRDEADVPPSR